VKINPSAPVKLTVPKRTVVVKERRAHYTGAK
jgi:hypothetical protein